MARLRVTSWSGVAEHAVAVPVAVFAVLAAVLVASSPGRSAPATARARSTASFGRVTFRLVLDQTRVRVGGQLNGELIVTNETGAPIPTSCGGWEQVGLTNASVPYDGGWILPACYPPPLPRGVSSTPVTVPTTYGGCGMDGPTGGAPRCGESPAGIYNVMPLLPAGIYYTDTEISLPGFVPAPTVPAVEVTIVK